MRIYDIKNPGTLQICTVPTSMRGTVRAATGFNKGTALTKFKIQLILKVFSQLKFRLIPTYSVQTTFK